MRKFGPKTADHPSVGLICMLCDEPFLANEYTTLIVSEPANDEEAAKKAAGRAYNAKADEVHWNCAKVHEKQQAVLTYYALQITENTRKLTEMSKFIRG